jgi:hypothetical protein
VEISEEHALLVCGRHFQFFLHVCPPPPNYPPHLLNKVEWVISYATILHPFHVHDGVWNGTQLCLKANQLMVAKDQEERVCKGKTSNYLTQLENFFIIIIIIKCHTCNYLSIMVQHYHNPQSGLLNHASIKKVCYMQWPHHLCSIDNGYYCMVNWSYSLGTNTKLNLF